MESRILRGAVPSEVSDTIRPMETARPWKLKAAIVAAVITGYAVIWAGWAIEIPFGAFSPGPVGDAIGSIEVDESLEAHPPSGELLMLTVYFQELNGFEFLVAWLDPSIDVIQTELVRRKTESDEEYRARVTEQMDRAKATAIRLALGEVGVYTNRVDGVLPEAPSAEFLEDGDLIVEVNGRPAFAPRDISAAIQGSLPGQPVEVVVERGGERLRFEFALHVTEDDPGRAIIGVQVAIPDLIEIDTSQVGGPSAGMMQTLAIIDLLTEGDLTGGRIVAGTGTISDDGTVGTIGGVRQKVVAAEAAGAEFMLLPAGNLAAASTVPLNTMQLVPVETLDEALAFLAGLQDA